MNQNDSNHVPCVCSSTTKNYNFMMEALKHQFQKCCKSKLSSVQNCGKVGKFKATRQKNRDENNSVVQTLNSLFQKYFGRKSRKETIRSQRTDTIQGTNHDVATAEKVIKTLMKFSLSNIWKPVKKISNIRDQ